jgi:hypothetical protein
MTRVNAILSVAMIAGTTLAVAQQSSVLPACSASGRTSQTYVDETLDQIKKSVPSLRGIKAEADQAPGGSTGDAQARSQTDMILNQASLAIAEMRHRIPNLIAKEEVIQRSGANSEGSNALASSGKSIYMNPGGPSTIGNVPGTGDQTRVYSYRIVPRTNSTAGDEFDEFRTDSHNRRIADATVDPDDPRTIGFATSWLIFLPENLRESRFRYLGRQKIGNYETYVLAFAQIPGVAHLDTVVGAAYRRCATHVQGVIWIDQSNYHIVRLQTDLLSPLPDIRMIQLRSILNYAEVRIPQRNLSLWLPKNVEASWQLGETNGDETHLYSNYRLFEATVRILPADASPTP